MIEQDIQIARGRARRHEHTEVVCLMDIVCHTLNVYRSTHLLQIRTADTLPGLRSFGQQSCNLLYRLSLDSERHCTVLSSWIGDSC